MKRIILLFSICILFASANACEICGCGVGNYYIGILPHFKNKFIGLRYHFSSFSTRLTGDPSQFSNDFYQTVEVWSGWNLGKRLQILAVLPYNFNHQVSDEGTSNHNGLGDAMALLNFKVLDINGGNKKAVNELWLGGGVKLPTGKFEIENGLADIAAIANTQQGSGSVDFLISAMHNLRVNNWGLSNTASYKVNTTNKDDYKFGNKFTASSFVFYSVQASKTIISPNFGLQYEYNKTSQLSKQEVELTGGSLFQAITGAEISFNKMAIGFNVQLPLAQNFADGQTQSKLKGMAHVTFAL
jgi:hypothetical protein